MTITELLKLIEVGRSAVEDQALVRDESSVVGSPAGYATTSGVTAGYVHNRDELERDYQASPVTTELLKKALG